MTPEQPTDLDYELLDDVLPGITTPSSPLRGNLNGCRAVTVGPLVEYAFQIPGAGGTLPPLSEVAPSDMTEALARVLASRWSTLTTKTSSMDSRPFEFSRVPDAKGVNDPYWVAFITRVRHAAGQAGFDDKTARMLTGSFFELADNIWEHSNSSTTATVGYRRETGTFEFVIADAGIGVVASLNSKPEFATLSDAGTALETALSLADTPYGRRSGRGNGYRTMFANLVNLWGTVRVRSGDHGIVIDGTSPSVHSARTFQTLPYQGFIVAVTCRPQEKSSD